jgi:transcription-repair coupling factor (superfamily II helicase)
VGNLLDYALLKAAAERLLVASIDRRGDQLAIKFHEDTPVRPEKLVSVIRQPAPIAPGSERRSVAELEG